MNRTELLKISKPILFNTEMVKAILEGRKTVTRRVIKIKDNRGIWEPVNNCRNHEYGASVPCYLHREKSVDDCSPNIVYPKIDVGDILYVRETWYYENHMHDLTAGEPDLSNGEYSHRYVYRASNPDYPVDKWKPSIHMPKSAARIFLKVTDVRVERLQDMYVDDAINEGAWGNGIPILPFSLLYKEHPKASCNAIASFAHLWDSTMPKKDIDRYGWEANPWVWVYEFERVECDEVN